jgi:hypothetical protein
MATTIPLSKPIKKGEGQVTELVFKEPKIGHLMATDDHKPNSLAGDLALLSQLTGVPELILRQIDPEDWPAIRLELRTVYARFMNSSRAVTAALMALELDEDDLGELVAAWAGANGRPLAELLWAMLEREEAKDPQQETAARS